MWFFNSPEIVFGEGRSRTLRNCTARARTSLQISNGPVWVCRSRQGATRGGEHRNAGFCGGRTRTQPRYGPTRRRAIARVRPRLDCRLGGGSAMDAAKAMWALYERPDLAPDGINPLEYLGLGKKARLITISTTSGTGAEVTWALVLSDPAEKRKLGLGSRETLATMAIVDPIFAMKMPPRLTADTGWTRSSTRSKVIPQAGTMISRTACA